MNVDEIRALLDREIGLRGTEKNLHGIRVSDALVTPVQVPMAYPYCRDGVFQEDEALVWLLLEQRTDGSGYKIVYDEDNGLFGLATPGEHGRPLIVSCCSTFMDAFVGM